MTYLTRIRFLLFGLLFFSSNSSFSFEREELKVMCEQALEHDDIDSLRNLYEDALLHFGIDEQYEMKRQQGNVLAYASFFGHKNVVMGLLDRGVDPNIQSYYGSCALLYAIGNGHIDIIQLLLEFGANVDSCNGYGESTLSVAKSFPTKVIREKMLDILHMYGVTIEEESQV